MSERIRTQRVWHLAFYAIFGLGAAALLLYYLSFTLVHPTTPQQFPDNSFARFPLTWLIFPAEAFSLVFALYFVYTLWTDRFRPDDPDPLPHKKRTSVAVLLPVYHEPADVVERTLKACSKLRWPGSVNLYLLEDGTEETSKREMKRLARRYGATYVDRPDKPKGKKAGNINYAVKSAVKEPYFVILDSDQAPHPDFLERTMDHFSDSSVGFVQAPQHFIGERTPLQRAAKVGTNIFYQAMCVSKARDGALPFCGTNAVIRREAFEAVNGFAYYTATEDIDLGLRMNQRGYHGAYVPEVLVEGYAPPDIAAYTSQQYRWANGNLAILREYFPKILAGKFSLRHQVHTLFTLGWWVIGVVTLLYVLVPLLSLWLGLGTHHTWLPTAVLVLLYINVGVGIGMIYVSLKGRLRSERVSLWDAFLQYSLLTNSMFIYARAAFSAAIGRYVGFIRTDKSGAASGVRHIKWNLLLGLACFASSVWALYHAAISADLVQLRTFLPISVWLLFYSLVLFSSILFVGRVPDAAPAPATQKQAEVQAA